MPVVPIVQGMINLIQENIIANTNVVSNALTGQIQVQVENSFHFQPLQEIVLVDSGYNDSTSPHYKTYEYSIIAEVNNTHWITLTAPIQDPNGGWLVSNNAIVQKTIGHSPLYNNYVLYGDRETIPTDEMAMTIEPQSLSNEWMYIHGGLSEEYRVGIMIYGKDLETDQGMIILNKYADAVYDLFNKNIHLDVTDYNSPMLANVSSGTNTIIVANTPANLSYFIPSNTPSTSPVGYTYEVQDNLGIEIDLWLDSVTVSGTNLVLQVYPQNPAQVPVLFNNTLQRSYSTAEFAVFTRHGMYFYDSRIDNIEYGMVQKGSAFVRAARLNWFGKDITEYRFPQRSQGVPYFPQV